MKRTKLGIADNEALLFHFLVRDLSFQKLFQVLWELSFNNAGDSRQGIGGVFKLLESLELNTRYVKVNRSIKSQRNVDRIQFVQIEGNVNIRFVGLLRSLEVLPDIFRLFHLAIVNKLEEREA